MLDNVYRAVAWQLADHIPYVIFRLHMFKYGCKRCCLVWVRML
jgi:hypothetical protein